MWSFLSAFSQDTFVKKWKISFQLDNRFTTVNEKNISIFGAKVGLTYKKLTRFGIGTSFALKPVTNTFVNNNMQTVENTNSFWYVGFFNDWILLKNNRWNCFVTEQIGVGAPQFTSSINGQTISDEKVILYVNELSAQAQYKIIPWLGVGAGIGYRHSLNNDAHIKSVVNGPVFIAKVIVYPGAIFKFLEL